MNLNPRIKKSKTNKKLFKIKIKNKYRILI